MKKVYFEIGGKKLMMKVDAKNDSQAKQKIFDKITFHKIEEDKIKPFAVDDEFFEKLKDIFGESKF